jgi:hypothetical protein
LKLKPVPGNGGERDQGMIGNELRFFPPAIGNHFKAYCQKLADRSDFANTTVAL